MKKLLNVHPGEILEMDFLKPMGISIQKISKSIGLEQSVTVDIICGKTNITEEIAKSFSFFLVQRKSFG